jgi:hypothetical protein
MEVSVFSALVEDRSSPTRRSSVRTQPSMQILNLDGLILGILRCIYTARGIIKNNEADRL